MLKAFIKRFTIIITPTGTIETNMYILSFPGLGVAYWILALVILHIHLLPLVGHPNSVTQLYCWVDKKSPSLDRGVPVTDHRYYRLRYLRPQTILLSMNLII